MTTALKISDQLAYVHTMPRTNATEIAHGLEFSRPTDSQLVVVGLYGLVSPEAPEGRNIYAVTATPYDRTIEPGIASAPNPLKKLLVVCDTLTVACRWWLPECDVQIHARVIEFQGEGCIDTSPAPWSVAKAADAAGKQKGKDGANGKHAGDISVLVDKVLLPQGASRPRLIARGGNGQSGGKGLDGTAGRDSPSNRLGFTGSYTHHSSHADSGVKTSVKAKLDQHGDHTIIGIRSKWRVAAVFNRDEQTWGTLEFPSDGTDAVAPGDAGNGGNGGKIYCNDRILLGLAEAAAGQAGQPPVTARGGRAGAPSKAAYYDNLYYFKWDAGGIFDTIENDNTGMSEINCIRHSTQAGADKTAKAGEEGKSWAPEEAKSGKTNLWLHPRIVPSVLDYIRRAYLSEQRLEARNLLAAYTPAFQAGIPARAKGSEWTAEDESYWLAVGMELAVLDQRLNAGLDYFGHPAGYTPLLSLASSFRLYRMELDAALEVLLFAGWIDAKQHANWAVAEESSLAANLLQKENADIARWIVEAEKRNEELHGRIVAIDQTQNRLLDRIGVLRVELTNKASREADRIADIKLAANLAAGLLQLVPVGQPILGGIASTAADASDFLDEEPEKVSEKLKTRLKDAVDAYKEAQKASKEVIKQAKDKANELAKAEGKKLTVDEIKQLNKTTDPAWKTAAKGIGPALGHFKAAYEKGQVSRASIDAQLAKLAKADPEWQKLSTEIARLADDKADLIADLMATAQAVGQQFAVLADNTAAIGRLDATAASAASRMLGASGREAIREMRKRAVMTLTEALYSLVRAFESVRFESVDVDWSIESFLKTLVQAIDAQSMDQWDDNKLRGRIDTLKIAFTDTLRNVRNQLAKGVKNLQATVSERHFTLDAELGARVMDDLNRGVWIRLDTLDLEFVSPDRQRQLLVGIEPLSIAFRETELPSQGDLEILLEIDNIGIVRNGTGLYGMRLPAPLILSSTYHFGTGRFTQARPSEAAKDLLNIVLDDMDERIRQRMALPAAWTTLRVKVAYSGLRSRQAPTIQAIGFRADIDSQATERGERVLHAAAMDGCTPLMATGIDTPPFISGYFIFPSPGLPVELASADPARPVRHWRISKGGRRSEQAGPTLRIDVDPNLMVLAEL